MNLFRKRELKRKKAKSSASLIVIFLLIIWYFFYNNYQNFLKNPNITETKQIIIKSWENFSNLPQKLPELNNLFFKIYLKYNKPTFILWEWTYEIEKNSSISQVIESLKTPIITSENVTILEWWNIYDIDKSLTKKWLINSWEYISYVTNKEKIIALSEFFPFLKLETLESLEWFLYPDTYRIDKKNFKINNFVISQLENFEKKVYEKLFSWKYDNSTTYDVVNLASIVEKEEWKSENKATVAWILKKRLNSWWQIWADATVCYPFKIPTSECTQAKVLEYLYEKNDYNTRQKTWLPKTPIANPSYETINATLNDNKTDYWYYLHNLTTGQIFYARTDSEHEFNKKNYMY